MKGLVPEIRHFRNASYNNKQIKFICVKGVNYINVSLGVKIQLRLYSNNILLYKGNESKRVGKKRNRVNNALILARA